MIVVRPDTYSKTQFEADHIRTLAQRSLERVAPLPDDLEVEIDVDENQVTNRVRVTSLDPVSFHVDGGALENYKQPRTIGDLPASITFTRLFLEVVDRLSETFGAPALDAELTQAHRMAWDVNLFGRVGRHGLQIHQPRYRYNYRSRHGFSDVADRTFDRLWSSDELTWPEIVELSDRALDALGV